jgi:DNA-binding transcriptional ArsR family regulator
MAEARKKPALEKALDVCEALSAAQRGLSVTDLARALRMPAPTVHRLLSVLKRRGYVRQDEDTQRYSLTLKVLDLSFRLLGGSELRLHAYPVLREFVLRTGLRSFLAVPSAGEVTYVWSVGPPEDDEVAMYTAYGKEMPGHCSIYFDARKLRRLTCIRMSRPRDAVAADHIIRRLGPRTNTDPGPRTDTDSPEPRTHTDPHGAMRVNPCRSVAVAMQCTCAPVHDYTGREVARVGVFVHAADDEAFARAHPPAAWELARLISLRLGHLPAAAAIA